MNYMSEKENISKLLGKEKFLRSVPVFQNTVVCTDLYSEKIQLSSLHQHQFIEISYVLDGIGVYRVMNEEYHCRKGSLSILNIAVPHRYFAKENAPRPTIRSMLFDINDILSGELSEIGNTQFLYGLFSTNNFAININLKQKQLDLIEDMYNSIGEEINLMPFCWREALRTRMQLFLITIKRIIEENGNISSLKFSSEQQAISRALQLINSKYNDIQFSLVDVAKLLYTSKATVSRMFHQVTGEYFSDYLRKVRMNHASELLKSSDLSNEEIAFKCGYKDVPTFYTQFKNFTGLSPGKYKNYMLANSNNTDKEILIMNIMNEISEKLQKGKAKDVAALVTQALEEGVLPEQILNEGLVDGMNIIGTKFRNNEVFVPEVLVAARAMNAGLKILKPALTSAGIEPIGKAVICTVKGDMHDIGKNLVKMMIEGQGIECVDLGVDVEASRVVAAVKESGAQLVCLSALLTTTMAGQKDVIDALKDAGIRDQVKVMIGGAPVTQEYADEIGADCYTLDAASAAQEARRLILAK